MTLLPHQAPGRDDRVLCRSERPRRSGAEALEVDARGTELDAILRHAFEQQGVAGGEWRARCVTGRKRSVRASTCARYRRAWHRLRKALSNGIVSQTVWTSLKRP